MKLLKNSFLFLLVMTSSSLFAFKLETHVWIAQQVLNDIQDGKLTIPVDGRHYEVMINDNIVAAIKKHPNEYRMGSIGPDASPDVIAGQMATHPGIQNGWGTDDWIKLMLGMAVYDNEKSYAYGYLSHAAADTMAHTYVNMYSGDVFLLSDGELEVEKRHYALEGYIADRTPPLQNHNGSPVGQPYNVVHLPKIFVRDTFILNSEVAKQYEKVPLTAYLAGIQNLREKIVEISNDPILDEMDVIAIQMVAEYWANIPLTNEQARLLAKYSNRIKEIEQEYLSAFVNELVRLDLAVRDNLISLSLTQSFNQRALALEQDFMSMRERIMGIETQIAARIIEQGAIPNFIEERVCHRRTALFSPSLALICEIERRLNPAYSEVSEQIRSLQERINQEQIDFRTRQLQALNGIVGELSDLVEELQGAERVIVESTLETARQLNTDINPVRTHLYSMIADIDNAMEAYVEASAQMMTETMKPEGQRDILKPIEDWVKCWSPIFLGVPGPISNGTCQFVHHIGNIRESIEELRYFMRQFSIAGSAINRVVDRIDELEEDFKESARDFAYDQLSENTKEILAIFTNNLTTHEFNQLFMAQPSSKALLKIDRASYRIDKEMHIANGFFNPDEYAVIYNAVILSKLAVFGSDEWSRLFNQIAFNDVTPEYGLQLYSGLVDANNILLGAVRSIDGNHQWMPLPPPFPRQNGFANPQALTMPFGYSRTQDSEKGFRIWQAESARVQLFRKIFKGPLVPGVDAPETISENRVLSANYPYDVCKAHPYPDDVEDRTCIVLEILPAILMMML